MSSNSGADLTPSHTDVMVSVIMITYNQERTIDEAIRSVVKQHTSFGYEVVVADDASTDSTLARCLWWQTKHPDKVRVIARKSNLGLQANFLNAYSHCRGRYIAICEGDDWWCSKHKLQRQYDYMEAHPECSICFHRVVNYFADKHTMSLSNGNTSRTSYSLADLSKGNFITNLSVMYRAMPYEELPAWLTEIKLFDYAMHCLHAQRGEIHYMSSPMAVYRQYAKGIWSGDSRRQWMLAMDVRLRLMRHFASDTVVAVNLMRAYTDIALSLYLSYSDEGDTQKSEEVKRMLLATMIEMSAPIPDGAAFESMLDRRRQVIRGAAPSMLRRAASSLRAIISMTLPLPRIR